ncbi:uncharacterized protein TRAVEDRAFT_87097, partial [Trametes versicolor FP-101664 SS1]|uniref:uncharacterized protein n=1 Tax=Trametes versicolor (strain FP-101664) TaxID=717944 RepID=UPI00046212E9
VLHPAYKAQYFRDHRWLKEWITVAIDITKEEWNNHYKPKKAAPANSAAMFASINRKDTTTDALDKYLEAAPDSTVDDPLKYWNTRLESTRDKSSPEAALARMALDFLSAPATSTDAERSFSCGHLTVSRLRHSLADESVRTSTILGSWALLPDVLAEDELVEVIKAHS